jgi:hypothetical protein
MNEQGQFLVLFTLPMLKRSDYVSTEQKNLKEPITFSTKYFYQRIDLSQVRNLQSIFIFSHIFGRNYL